MSMLNRSNYFHQSTILFFLISAFILANVPSFATPTRITPKFNLKKVTVYFTGAELNYQSSVRLKKGRNYIQFKNVSEKIKDGSIRASFDNNVRILQVSTEFIKIEVDKNIIRQKEDSINMLDTKIRRLSIQSGSYKTEREILTSNIRRIGKDESVSSQELAATMALCRTKLKELDNLLFDLDLKKDKLTSINNRVDEKLDALYKQQNAVNNNNQSTQIIIEVESSKDVVANSKLSYLVRDAGWSPKYDIRAFSVDQPVTLEYKARVFNNTQVPWENVVLELSTATQNRKLERPELGYAWSLSYKGRNAKRDFSGEGLLSDKQLKESEKENDLEYSQIEVPQLDIMFKIDLPATIISDKKPHLVSIGSFELPTSYKFYSAPKIDDNVYKIAAIRGWEKLNLIEGESSIYLNEAYLGDSYLNPKYSDKEMKISLGTDPKIQISRVKKQDKEEETTIGTNRSVNLTYDIDIRNNYEKAVEVEIVDQVPISSDDDLQVNVTETSNAKLDDQSGKLTWYSKLKPGKFQKLTVSFEVKFPRSKNLSSFSLFKFQRGGVMCPKFR